MHILERKNLCGLKNPDNCLGLLSSHLFLVTSIGAHTERRKSNETERLAANKNQHHGTSTLSRPKILKVKPLRGKKKIVTNKTSVSGFANWGSGNSGEEAKFKLYLCKKLSCEIMLLYIVTRNILIILFFGLFSWIGRLKKQRYKIYVISLLEKCVKLRHILRQIKDNTITDIKDG